MIPVNAAGVAAAADMTDLQSPETYVGYDRAANFISPGGAVRDARHVYAAPTPRLNQWALSGGWTIGGEHAALDAKGGGIVYRFHARDLHLVLGPGADGKPSVSASRSTARRRARPSRRHWRGWGGDRANSSALSPRPAEWRDRRRTFEIRFLDPGVQAYAFTFG